MGTNHSKDNHPVASSATTPIPWSLSTKLRASELLQPVDHYGWQEMGRCSHNDWLQGMSGEQHNASSKLLPTDSSLQNILDSLTISSPATPTCTASVRPASVRSLSRVNSTIRRRHRLDGRVSVRNGDRFSRRRAKARSCANTSNTIIYRR